MRRLFIRRGPDSAAPCASAFAQQTTGNITGRVVDEQGAAIPGVTVTAKNPATGFTRTEVSDAEGVYRLSALPVGIYDVTAELQGFTHRVQARAIEVNVAQTRADRLHAEGRAAGGDGQRHGATPLIDTTSSSVGGVVDVQADREPAAQRPAVREPRGDGAGRRPRLPHATRPRARSTRRRSTAATAATSTTRSTAATTTTTRSAACCSSSRSKRSRSSTSRRSASRPSTAAATAA